MQIVEELSENKGLSLALGYFDGVHKGHRSVIKSAVDFAHQNAVKSAVVTFKDHPCCFFYGVCPKYILSREDRIKYIEELGVDYLYMLDFEKISKLSGNDYIENVLVKYFEPKSISTGFNHFFGRKKSGDTQLLEKYKKVFGYEYFKIPPQTLNGQVISSTTIRNLLSGGDIENADKMLLHDFSVSGVVIEGNKIGRTIGFRTANINYPPELIEIPFGAYSTEVNYGENLYKGVANFGIKPTIAGGNKPVLEVHILDFDKDIYGQKIRVSFKKMLRKEKKFLSLDELKNQIAIDCKSC